MDARVSQSSRYGNITAFSGREYVKYEWRAVPAGFEAEAERNPYLEIKPEEFTHVVVVSDESETSVYTNGAEGGKVPVGTILQALDPGEVVISVNTQPVIIDPADGIDEAEASAAGKALAAKKAQDDKPKKRGKG